MDDDIIVSHLYIHVLFSTEGQEPSLDDEGVREGLAHFIGGALQDMKCAAVQSYVGVDHMHVLIRQSDEISVDACINALKKESMGWLRREYATLGSFNWQESYGAFSVGGDDLSETVEYLRDQPEYHLIHSFEDEFRGILRENEIEFDENELWE